MRISSSTKQQKGEQKFSFTKAKQPVARADSSKIEVAGVFPAETGKTYTDFYDSVKWIDYLITTEMPLIFQKLGEQKD